MFNDLTDAKFILHLKESECRFNHRNDNFASFVERIFWGEVIKDTSLEPCSIILLSSKERCFLFMITFYLESRLSFFKPFRVAFLS